MFWKTNRRWIRWWVCTSSGVMRTKKVSMEFNVIHCTTRNLLISVIYSFQKHAHNPSFQCSARVCSNLRKYYTWPAHSDIPRLIMVQPSGIQKKILVLSGSVRSWGTVEWQEQWKGNERGICQGPCTHPLNCDILKMIQVRLKKKPNNTGIMSRLFIWKHFAAINLDKIPVVKW